MAYNDNIIKALTRGFNPPFDKNDPKYKEKYELAPMNYLLLVEEDNEDKIYFVRIYADEYEIGYHLIPREFCPHRILFSQDISPIKMIYP